MKFFRGVILSSLIILIVLTNISHSSSLQAKRRQSLMEYMNNFFSDNNLNPNSNIDENEMSSQIKRSSHSSKSRPFRFKESISDLEEKPKAPVVAASNSTSPITNSTNAASNITAAENSDTASITGVNPGTVERPSTADPLLSEWFMVSSKAFRDIRKFPPITLRDNSQVRIEVDIKDFRINNAHGNPMMEEKLPSNKFFWFRLSGLNIYYSSTKSDINILGAIAIDSLSTVVSTGTDASTEYITTCFTVSDHSKDKWKICGLDEVVVKKWYCQIKSFLNEEDLVLCPKSDASVPIVEKIINITQPIIIIPIPTRQCNQGWNYQNDGKDWECDCAEGKEQAPIDLPDIKEAVDSEVRPLFQYDSIDPKSVIESIDGIISNGKLQMQLKENLLRIFHNKFGKIITMEGAVYYAEEIVFHTPSEHTIKGKKYEMEMQVIHYGQSQGDIAKQIVLSFLFEKTPGINNQFIEDLNVFDLPNPTSTVRDLEGKIFIPNIFKFGEEDDITAMEPFSFYTYQGSLTFPPCTEDTIMYVSSKTIAIGSTALQLFQEALRVPDLMDQRGNVIVSDFVPKSARKIQPLNGRPVFHFDHEKFCTPVPKHNKKVSGHYEKIRKAMTNYFYVGGNDPSGLPNAYVVSEDEALGKGFGPKPRKI